MSDEEIKNYIALYFQFDDEQEYTLLCNKIKENGTSRNEVRLGLLKYVNKQIESNKLIYHSATGDFTSHIKAKASRDIKILDDLRKLLEL